MFRGFFQKEKRKKTFNSHIMGISFRSLLCMVQTVDEYLSMI